jgi:Ulp1 protease family, C-terminal catalytic domain
MRRTLVRSDGLPQINFEARELDILSSPTARLNDVCMNGGAALLQRYFSSSNYPEASIAQRCALLSTFDLVHVRYKATDVDLWRNVYRSSYWLKDVWIIPIHRPQAEHWVVCIASLQTRQLFLFDSLAARRPWRQDIKVSRNRVLGTDADLMQDVMRLITRLVLLANSHSKELHLITEGWTAQPVSVSTSLLCSIPR